MIEFGERIYPRSRLACVFVWLLDRASEEVRMQVLDSYWSPQEVERIKAEVSKWDDIFDVPPSNTRGGVVGRDE